MKKLISVCILVIFSLCLLGQEKKRSELFYQFPKEIQDLFKEQGKMIPFDANVKALFERYKNELGAVEYSQYLAYQEELKIKGPNADVPPPIGPWAYEIRCNWYNCTYSEICPPPCTWRWGCGECMEYCCPAGHSGYECGYWTCMIGCCF